MGKVLIGKYAHSLDAKGRVSFPAKMREDMGDHVILTQGWERCLFVYSLEEWARLDEKIKALPMSKAGNLQRFLFASAVDVELDKQGRLLIPQDLRDYAGLTKDVMITGVSVRAEIWDRETWLGKSQAITPEMVAQAMDELGF